MLLPSAPQIAFSPGSADGSGLFDQVQPSKCRTNPSVVDTTPPSMIPVPPVTQTSSGRSNQTPLAFSVEPLIGNCSTHHGPLIVPWQAVGAAQAAPLPPVAPAPDDPPPVPAEPAAPPPVPPPPAPVSSDDRCAVSAPHPASRM